MEAEAPTTAAAPSAAVAPRTPIMMMYGAPSLARIALRLERTIDSRAHAHLCVYFLYRGRRCVAARVLHNCRAYAGAFALGPDECYDGAPSPAAEPPCAPLRMHLGTPFLVVTAAHTRYVAFHTLHAADMSGVTPGGKERSLDYVAQEIKRGVDSFDAWHGCSSGERREETQTPQVEQPRVRPRRRYSSSHHHHHHHHRRRGQRAADTAAAVNQ